MVSNFRWGIIAKACYGFHECDKTNLRTLFTELYKTIKGLNSNVMTDLFLLWLSNRTVLENNEMHVIISEFNQVSSGKKSLRMFSSKLWNSWQYDIESPQNFDSFKEPFKITISAAMVNTVSVMFVIAATIPFLYVDILFQLKLL